MKRKTTQSLIFKISAINLILILLIMSAIGITVSLMMTNTVTAITEEEISLLADENARSPRIISTHSNSAPLL